MFASRQRLAARTRPHRRLRRPSTRRDGRRGQAPLAVEAVVDAALVQVCCGAARGRARGPALARRRPRPLTARPARPRSIISYVSLSIVMLCVYHLFSDGDFSVLMVRAPRPRRRARPRAGRAPRLTRALSASSLARRRWGRSSTSLALCFSSSRQCECAPRARVAVRDNARGGANAGGSNARRACACGGRQRGTTASLSRCLCRLASAAAFCRSLSHSPRPPSSLTRRRSPPALARAPAASRSASRSCRSRRCSATPCCSSRG